MSGSNPMSDGLVENLRRGDDGAYRELVERYHRPMVRLARRHLPSRSLAEEAVQETWMGVMRGIHAFEGRGSLKNWIYRILLNRARSLARRESRARPFSSVATDHVDSMLWIDPDVPIAEARWPDRMHPWESPSPEDSAVSQEFMKDCMATLRSLPPRQRLVLTLRDIHHWSSSEVCNALEMSPANQRVMLHRGRRRLRSTMEARELASDSRPPGPEPLPRPTDGTRGRAVS